MIDRLFAWLESRQQLIVQMLEWKRKYTELEAAYEKSMEVQLEFFETKKRDMQEGGLEVFRAGACWQARRTKLIDPLPHKTRRAYADYVSGTGAQEYD